jgi:hypothetical protein
MKNPGSRVNREFLREGAAKGVLSKKTSSAAGSLGHGPRRNNHKAKGKSWNFLEPSLIYLSI